MTVTVHNIVTEERTVFKDADFAALVIAVHIAKMTDTCRVYASMN